MHKVFILTNTLKTGGAEKQSIYLFKALRKRFETNLVVYYGNQYDQRLLDLLPKDCSGNVIFLEGNHFKKAVTLYKLFKQSSDTICISYLATTNTINAIIGTFAGVKIRIGGIRSSRFHWFKKIVQRHLHNHWLTCSIFNNNRGSEELISEGFKKEKGIVIFNCIEMPNSYVKEHDIQKINILTVGRFVEEKDYLTAFLSIKELIKNNINLKYTIVGQGELENTLKCYISENELENYVEFVINPPNVEDYYNHADIYLSTSLFEGLSNSIMEAMSFNLPVVATDVGDNKYLVLNNETGFLLPAKDVEGISIKLEALINNADLRKKMGENGYGHITQTFSIDKFTQEYTNLIERLMDAHQ